MIMQRATLIFKSTSFVILRNALLKQNRSYLLSHLRTFSNSKTLFAERKYTEQHEWVETKDAIATVGVTNYAQEALGDVVYVQLPDVGVEYSQQDECGTVESVKAASEIYTPISGKICEINKLLEETPGLINTSCYQDGWLFKLEMTKPEEVKALMNEEKYNKFLKTLEE